MIIRMIFKTLLKHSKETLLIDPEVRRQNAYKARRALDKLRPKYIKEDWINLLVEITTGG